MKKLIVYSIILITFILPSCKKDKNNQNNLPQQTFTSNSVTTNLTLDVANYLIDHIVNVNGAVLTIPAGTILTFTDQGGFITSNGGAIKAVGTAANPILFTGKEAIKGYWFGIDINTNSLNNQFEYCQFQYAGKGIRSSVRLGSNGATVTKAVFKNCTFANGKKNGLFVNEQSTISGSQNNVFTANDEYPISIAYQNVSELDATNSYTGNTKDMVLVYTDEISALINGDVTFNKIGVPYFISNTAGYLFKGKVTVKPGVTLIMEANNAIRIDATGAFYCVGSSAERITIKGLEATQGYWDRIIFKGSTSGNNRIEYTDLSDGGSNNTEVGLYSPPATGMIALPIYYDLNNVVIKNSSVSNAKYWGIRVNGVNHTVNGVTGASNIQSSLTGNGNTYSGNGSGNVYVN